MIPLLHPGAPFPPVDRALHQPDGLLAAGGDLSVDTLLRAYRQGIFPWFSDEDPILWWAPSRRMVLPTDGFHLTRSLRRTLRRGTFRVTCDEAFDGVLRGCAAPRADQDGTWLSPEMQVAYRDLKAAGYAHSVEVWCDGALAGGLYVVAVGQLVCGESMFSRRTDASKVALAWLAAQCRRWGMPIIDCQLHTGHLESLGARLVSRHRFMQWVAALSAGRGPQAWRFDADLDPVAELSASPLH
jgi:leucyl/phenylalanyl-tRNA--protein transferase